MKYMAENIKTLKKEITNINTLVVILALIFGIIIGLQNEKIKSLEETVSIVDDSYLILVQSLQKLDFIIVQQDAVLIEHEDALNEHAETINQIIDDYYYY